METIQNTLLERRLNQNIIDFNHLIKLKGHISQELYDSRMDQIVRESDEIRKKITGIIMH